MVETRDLPLFAWGDALRAGRARRTRLRRRAGLIAAGIACLAATVARPPAPLVLWNASASAPVGLYAVTPGAPLARGDMAVAWPPLAVRDLAARRRYLPRGVPLVKRVAAVAGDRVCATGRVVTVNDRTAAIRRPADSAGRRLPGWQGCIRLDRGAVLLLMTEAPDSFDGRYFGITGEGDIVGRATQL